MPNWCDNLFKVTHSDPAMIDRFYNAYEQGQLCNEFIPTPEGLLKITAPNRTNPEEMTKQYGFPDWYSFRVAKWGTKWDIGSKRGSDGSISRDDSNTVSGSFSSAWSPPVELFKYLANELGYQVELTYNEPGNCFCGSFTQGFDICFAYDDLKELIERTIDDSSDNLACKAIKHLQQVAIDLATEWLIEFTENNE